MLTVYQKLAAYDEDASLSVDYLLSLPTCNGQVGATGMCLGGHLAYRCALDSRVKASVCYFATDIHSKTLAWGKNDDSLERAGDIKGEMLMVCLIWGRLLMSVCAHIGSRSSVKMTTTFRPRDETLFARPCMRRVFCLDSTRPRGHSVSSTHGVDGSIADDVLRTF